MIIVNNESVKVGVIAAGSWKFQYLIWVMHGWDVVVSITYVFKHKLLVFVCGMELLHYGRAACGAWVIYVKYFVRGQWANEIHAAVLRSCSWGSIYRLKGPVLVLGVAISDYPHGVVARGRRAKVCKSHIRRAFRAYAVPAVSIHLKLEALRTRIVVIKHMQLWRLICRPGHIDSLAVVYAL